MDEHRLERLTNACSKSKDARVLNIALAVQMVLVKHMSIADAVENMARYSEWIIKRVARFEEEAWRTSLTSLDLNNRTSRT